MMDDGVFLCIFLFLVRWRSLKMGDSGCVYIYGFAFLGYQYPRFFFLSSYPR